MNTRNAFWIDVGGTFTDCLLRAPAGGLRTHKLLSDGTYRGQIADCNGDRLIDPRRGGDPHDFFADWQLAVLDADGVATMRTRVRGNDAGGLHLAEPLHAGSAGCHYLLHHQRPAPASGIRYLLGLAASAPVGPLELRLGTTRGTNALLERKGARVGLLITSGFADLLRIRDQRRPHLFELEAPQTRPLYDRVAELPERIAADGQVLRALDATPVAASLAAWRAEGIESVAVACLNSYRNPVHEQMAANLAREAGFRHVSTSHALSPLSGYLRRAETAVVNAYLQPVVADYLAQLQAELPEAEVLLMSSAGGLLPAGDFAPKDSILSGPAAGVVGAASVGRTATRERIIAFDMGGTSTDVSRYDGGFAQRGVLAIRDPETGAELEIVAPQLEIETVAAGGGSICGFDGVKPTVGPASAGADPGPACYGAGGPLCLTDVNLLLGRLPERRFSLPLERGAARRRIEEQIDVIRTATGRAYAEQELAAGYLRIANEHMAAAIRRISLQRGVDVRDFALVAFGGAGGQHACAVAELLGVRTVLCHPLAGLLSAYGIGMAPRQRIMQREVGRVFEPRHLPHYDELVRELQGEVRAGLPAGADIKTTLEVVAELRYAGQEETLSVPFEGAATADTFAHAYRNLYGYTLPDRSLELVALRVEGTQASPPEDWDERTPPEAASQQQAWTTDGVVPVPVVSRDGWDSLDGPALICDPFGTIVLEPGWTATRSGSTLVLQHLTAAQAPTAGDARDAIELELFHNRFSGVAEEMGATLQRAALSTNIRERCDFSCAVCDPDGYLVAHAPHVPVHLGAIGACVRHMLAEIAAGRVSPLTTGDMLLCNDPYTGGSHLPDVTVIAPLLEDGCLVGFVANRAHHAEIGGITPGSMPPRAASLAEEGVLLRWVRCVDPATGALLEGDLRKLLTTGPHPSRDPEQNLADLRAQVAANRRGLAGLRTLRERHGVAATTAYMEHIQAAADEHLQQVLAPRGTFRGAFRDQLDDGTPIAVSLEVSADGIVVDFAGSGPVSPTSLNATPAIVRSAVLYCLRCLVEDEIPLNEGLLRRVTLRIPPGLLHPPADPDPRACPGVAGGNVETSQRIVDCVLGALQVVAASQGTMNNLTFGDGRFGYYETIGGGVGAGPNRAGASARHSHMTNTRLTDPETLERRFPVRLIEFAVRTGSGGTGRHRGGDGMIRTFEFLRPLDLTLLTQRRRTAPYGLAGGGPGAPGRNLLIRGGGEPVELDWFAEVQVAAGDRLRIETPGGGGCGSEQPGT